MFMKKAEEKKFIKMIKDILGEAYKPSDDVLIQELADWISISEKAKDDLRKEVKTDGEMGWQNLTTISMASKQIQSVLKHLGITPAERNRLKVVVEKADKFDLNKFLNQN